MPVSDVLWTEIFGEITASSWNKHLLSSYFVSTNLRLTTTTSVVLSFWKSFHPSGDFRILGWRRAFLGQSLLFCMACLWRPEESEVHFQSSGVCAWMGRKHTQGSLSIQPGSTALPVTGPQSCEGCFPFMWFFQPFRTSPRKHCPGFRL